MPEFVDTYGWKGGLSAPTFGKRAVPPPKPFYKVWSSKLGRSHVAVISEPDAYQARLAYVAFHGCPIEDVSAELMLPSR